MQPSTPQVRELVWEGMVDTHRLHLYYGYLTQRLVKRNGALRLLAAVASSAVLAGFFLDCGGALALLGLSLLAAVLNVLLAGANDATAIAHSLDMHRQLSRLTSEWQFLWARAEEGGDPKLRDKLVDLTRRTDHVTEQAAASVPQVNRLKERAEEEAYTYWTHWRDQHA